VLQVATQIREITLSYVPKLVTAAVLLLLLGGWMLGELTQFAISLYHRRRFRFR
jgi:flagellar biosynthetic protein FliQ